MTPKIYTRKGDDGTTGLLYGGRVRKDSELPSAYGDVDEAQAFIGLARADAGDAELADLLVSIEHDLYVLMAELATAPAAPSPKRLTPP
jgi:cob(I)alamin adenosyltransferase